MSLVALAWIGRGSFGPEELEEALATARAERSNRTEEYLLGMPLLPDYLEEALDRLGYSVEDAEDDYLVSGDEPSCPLLLSRLAPNQCSTSLA